MSFDSLSDDKKTEIINTVLPVFRGWTVVEIYEATNYLKTIACNCSIDGMPTDINDFTKRDKGYLSPLPI